MAAFLDICRFNPAAGGTADWTYVSPVTGYQGFAAAAAIDGRLYKYRAESADLSQWELGEGAYNARAGTLARTTILSNSSGTTSKINFLAAPQVAIVALKADLIAIEEDNTFTDAQKAQARRNILAAPIDAMLSNGLQVNGAMDVSQERGTASIALSTGQSGYPADQFIVSTVGSQVLVAQNVADAPAGLSRSVKLMVTTANTALGVTDFASIRQRVEGYRCQKLGFGAAGAQSLSIGFWVKAHRTGTYTVTVLNAAGNRGFMSSYSISAADIWEYKTVTIAGDISGTWLKDNGTGLELIWTVAAGSALIFSPGSWVGSNWIGASGQVNGVAATSDTFQLTGVIVLPGTELPAAARSALIQRPYDAEIALCSRYWSLSQVAVDYQATVASEVITASFNFPVPMRASPTISTFVAATSSNGAIVALGSSVPVNSYGGILQYQSTTSGRAYWYGLVANNARL